MDVSLLTYFVAVVDHGSVTRAAEALYISQPSLSQAIRTLERRLDAQLFRRVGRNLELTDAGRRFDTAARTILADVDRARARVDAVRELRAGRVDVVTYPAFSIDPLVGLIKTFRERHPAVAVQVLDAAGPDDAQARLRDGEAEIALTDAAAGPGTRSLPVCDQELVVVLPPGIGTDLPDPVPRDALGAVPLAVNLADTAYSEVLTGGGATGPGAGLIDCAHLNATHELVSRSVAATLMPRHVARHEFPGLDHRSLSPAATRTVGLTLRSGTPSPAAAAFAAVARERSRR